MHRMTRFLFLLLTLGAMGAVGPATDDAAFALPQLATVAAAEDVGGEAAPYIVDIWTSDTTEDSNARKTDFYPTETIVFWTYLANHPGGRVLQDLGFFRRGKLVAAWKDIDYGDLAAGSWYLYAWTPVPDYPGTYAWATRLRGPGYTVSHGHPSLDHQFTIH